MVVAGYNSMRFNLSYSPFHYVSVCIVIFYTQFQQFSSNTINYLFLKNVSNFVHINKTVLISDVHLLFLFFRYEKTLFFKERKLSIECQWMRRYWEYSCGGFFFIATVNCVVLFACMCMGLLVIVLHRIDLYWMNPPAKIRTTKIEGGTNCKKTRCQCHSQSNRNMCYFFFSLPSPICILRS